MIGITHNIVTDPGKNSALCAFITSHAVILCLTGVLARRRVGEAPKRRSRRQGVGNEVGATEEEAFGQGNFERNWIARLKTEIVRERKGLNLGKKFSR